MRKTLKAAALLLLLAAGVLVNGLRLKNAKTPQPSTATSSEALSTDFHTTNQNNI